jgi:nucleotide-binding universal stress UspA family protein
MMTFPPRRILAALDFTSPSLRAWKRARALADRFGAAVDVLYVVPFEAAGAGLYPLPRPSLVEFRALRARVRKIVGEDPRVIVMEGDPAACILKTAASRKSDLIVMGSHGRRGVARVMLGSVAEAVARRSPAPVYIEREGGVEPRAVLAPVHFTSYANRGFLYAAAAAAGLGARMTALFVNPDPIWGGNATLRLRTLVESLPAELRARCDVRVLPGEDAAEGIVRAAAKHDLLVLVAHRKSILGDAVFGTTAERVLRRTRKSLLIVPHAKKVVAAGSAPQRYALSA